MTSIIEKITVDNWFPIMKNKNMFPHEYFIKTIFNHNYLIHSSLITSYEQIDNIEFKEYIKQLPNIFDNNKCLLFKNELPDEYSYLTDKFIFFRPGGYIKLKEKKDPLIKMDQYLGMNIMEEMKKGDNMVKFKKYVSETSYSNLIENNIFPTYCSHLKKLYDSYAIIPCTTFNNFEDEYKQTNFFVDSALQKKYGEYINKKNELNETKPITFCFEKKRTNAKISNNENCYLYWIDIDQLHFKHEYISNSGVIDADEDDEGYTVLNNSIEITKNNNFFLDLMSKIHGEVKVNGKTIYNPYMCPIEVFLIDGILYSHDHKRLTASLLAGVKYILGTINQDIEKIELRSVGYHYNRCLFSKNDTSLMLKLSPSDMKKFGHYFFIVGTNDSTSLLKFIMSSSLKDRMDDIKKNAKLYAYLNRFSSKIEKCKEYSNNLFSKYFITYDNKNSTSYSPFKLDSHFACIPNLFESLNNPKIKKSYKILISKLFCSLNNKKSKKIKYISNTLFNDYEHERENIYKEKMNIYKNIDNYKYLKYLTKFNTLKLDRINFSEKMYGGNKYESVFSKYRLSFDNEENKEKLSSFLDDIEGKVEDSTFKNILNIHDYLKLCLNVESSILKNFVDFINLRPIPNLPFIYIIKNISSLKTELEYNDDILIEIVKNLKLCKEQKIDKPVVISSSHIKKHDESSEIFEKTKSISTTDLSDVIIKLKTIIENFDTLTNIELIKWELKNISLGIGNIENPLIKHKIIDYILEEPNLNKITKIILPELYPSIYKNSNRPTRYSKTNDGILEDLVLLFRIAYDAKLWDIKKSNLTDFKDKKADQIYSIDDLKAWQNFTFIKKKNSKYINIFKFLNPDIFDFDQITLDTIINNQKKDHIRIFKTEKNMYGAYQGLQDTMLYSFMKPFNFYVYGKYTLHTTELKIANSILSGASVKGPSIEPSERYIHGFVNVEYNEDNNSYMLNNTWKFKMRLMSRFFTRYGICINMEVLYDFYNLVGIDWFNVCSVNDIGTIIFYQRIPPHAIIAKDRVVKYIPVPITDEINYEDIIQQIKLKKEIYDKMISNTTIINTGSPYDICDIMNIHSINDIIEQFNYEYYLLEQ